MPNSRSLSSIDRWLASRFAFAALLLSFPGPTAALDFSHLPTAFLEDFVGETAWPTTPEIDLLGTSGALAFIEGSISGGAARVEINPPAEPFNLVFAAVDSQEVLTTGTDVGMRADFASLTLPSTGYTAASRVP